MKLLYTDEENSSLTYEFFMKIVEAVFDYLNNKENQYEISLLITNDETIHLLNKEYRQKDKPTDVLSFPMEDEVMLGDIVISLDTAKNQAQERDINVDREVAFLFIHGLLHLLGYDHETSVEDEKEMFDLQEEILKKLIDYGAVS